MLPIRHIESAAQLLVEGNDQRNFFEAFTSHLGIQDVQIQNFGGVNDLTGFLQGLVAEDWFHQRVRSIGIVRDAERNAHSAFQSAQDSLRNAGLVVPAQPARRAGGSPSVSVFILPDNRNAGMLETLLCQTFQGEPIGDCVEDFLRCARSAGGRRPEKPRQVQGERLSIHHAAPRSLGRRSRPPQLLEPRPSRLQRNPRIPANPVKE